MLPALWIAKSGLDAQQTNMSVISNNLANANTTGFKRGRAVFEDLMYQNVRQVGGNNTQDYALPSGLHLGTGVRTVGVQKDQREGNIQQTENSLDVAIKGRGFLQVLHPDGNVVYSRDGSFALDQNGQLVTAQGYPVQPAITIPQNAQSITIGRDGIVSVTQPGTVAPTQVGQLELANFVNPQGLEPIGDNLFRESQASGAATTGVPGTDSLGELLQGSLESSNVNVVEELVGMIEAQRTYEMNSKAISTSDQMLSYLNQQL